MSVNKEPPCPKSPKGPCYYGAILTCTYVAAIQLIYTFACATCAPKIETLANCHISAKAKMIVLNILDTDTLPVATDMLPVLTDTSATDMV